MDIASALSARRNRDRRPHVPARLLSIDPVALRAKVSIDGSEAVDLPFIPGGYDNITTVWVQRDPDGTGSGGLVLGPCAQIVDAPAPEVPTTPDPVDPKPKPVTDTALIRPTWSGTWSARVPAWDRWNVGRYGGRSSLYQGNAFGSGNVTGLAVYGTQVRDLNALSISRILVYTPIATGDGDVVLRPSAQGTSFPAGGPSPTGASASGSTAVDLPSSVCELFRTGAARGLCTVGSSYRATYGTSNPRGMALAITYTRAA